MHSLFQVSFKEMTKEQLQAELIKKNFEIARLKKVSMLCDTENTESDGH